jgi:hypothetical protein
VIRKTFNIELNTQLKQSPMTDIIISQGDNASVVFNFRIYNGANEIDYDNVSSAYLHLERPGRRLTKQQLQKRSGNGFTTILQPQSNALVGRVTGILALYCNDGSRVNTFNFAFTVMRDITPFPPLPPTNIHTDYLELEGINVETFFGMLITRNTEFSWTHNPNPAMPNDRQIDSRLRLFQFTDEQDEQSGLEMYIHGGVENKIVLTPHAFIGHGFVRTAPIIISASTEAQHSGWSEESKAIEIPVT